MKKTMLTFALVSGLATAAEQPVEQLSPQENQCKKQIAAYLALDRAKQRKDIEGISLIGFDKGQIQKRIEEKGNCATWSEIVLLMKRQHPEILDATEEMTGKPSPIR